MEKGGTMKVCRNCEEIIEEKNIVCPFCLDSVSDKQLPLDKLIKEPDTRKKQKKYEFRSHNYWRNKHKIR